jgi:cytochrome c biogenesis protein CcmG, thiol:disulfide interchange protein DsbE
MKRALQAGAVVVLLALVGLLALRLVQKDRGADFVSAIASGSQPVAPTFDLPALDTSKRVSLQSLRGKVVVVNFWASWCVGCQDEASDLNALAAQWSRKGVVFLGIDAQDLTSDARSFARAHNVRYPLVHASDDSIKDRYGVTGFPETFVIGRNGRAVYHLEVDELASAESLDGALTRAVAQ